MPSASAAGPYLDTALLRMDRRHVGVKRLEDLIAHARLGGDQGDDVDHWYAPEFLLGVIRPRMARFRKWEATRLVFVHKLAKMPD